MLSDGDLETAFRLGALRGLLANPANRLTLVNELRTDPRLRENIEELRDTLDGLLKDARGEWEKPDA